MSIVDDGVAADSFDSCSAAGMEIQKVYGKGMVRYTILRLPMIFAC